MIELNQITKLNRAQKTSCHNFELNQITCQANVFEI